MRLDEDWLRASQTQAVLHCLTDAGHEAYVVGGCVRNAILGHAVSDVDIATNARPETVTELARNAGFEPIPTGIDHGTVTVVVEGSPFEITTYRADVETDGRRAVVRYSDEITEDACRRDFTMNALYADAEGQVIDPLGGLSDALSGRVAFIDDACARIREDYLRILRFFRFSAWYGNPELGFDGDALSAIAQNLDGMSQLSAERIGAEIRKLFAAPDPSLAVAAMEKVGVLGHVLPGANTNALPVLVHHETELDVAPNALRRLAIIGFFDGALLRFSKADQRRLGLYQSLMGTTERVAELGYRHGYDMAIDIAIMRSALLGEPVAESLHAEAEKGSKARFPLKAADLMPAYEGKGLGDRLRELEDKWIASGFTLSKADLLG